MSVSVIIPTCDDNDALADLLKLIHTWSTQPHEIIVVDALANEQCEKLCQENFATWLSYRKNRGTQQKFGAEKASGSALWFLHADANPPIEGLAFIENSIASGSKGGFFKFTFNEKSPSVSQKIISAFTNWRSKHFIAYGDQGIFVKRDFYQKSGGHADQALFEEVQLIKALRQTKRISICNSPIKVSTRRWEKDGYWKRTLHNRMLAIAYAFGISTDKLSQWYTRDNKVNKVQSPNNRFD